MSTPEPVADHRDLPKTPLTVADLVGCDPLLLGGLVWGTAGPSHRPFVWVDVPCGCGATHRCPWRYDWGTAPDIVSYQALPCGAVAWIALDPATADDTASVRTVAHEAYRAWEKERKRRQRRRKRARRAAENAARLAAEASANGGAVSEPSKAGNASQRKPEAGKGKPPAKPTPPAPKRPARPGPKGPVPPPQRPAATLAERLAQRRATAPASSSLTSANLGASRQ